MNEVGSVCAFSCRAFLKYRSCQSISNRFRSVGTLRGELRVAWLLWRRVGQGEISGDWIKLESYRESHSPLLSQLGRGT